MKSIGIKDMNGNDLFEFDIIEDYVGKFRSIIYGKGGRWVAGSGFLDHDGIFIPVVESDSPDCGRRKIRIGNVSDFDTTEELVKFIRNGKN